MTPPRTVVRQAPGKLFVVGEYAVVEPGNPAILVAVDRQVTVTVSGPDPDSGCGKSDVVLCSDLAPEPVRLRWHDGRLAVCGTDGEQRAPSGVTYVASAIEVVGRLLAERGLPVPALSLSVGSRLHEDGRKYGLGSSGAVTVATVAAVASFCGLKLSPEARYRLALLATAQIDAKASGGDLAASTWGGWIAYRAPDRAFVLDLARRLGVDRTLAAPWPGFEVRRLPPPDGLSFEVGWTGEPASTTSLVSGLHRRTWRGTASHQRFVETTTDCVRAAAAALETGDRQDLLQQIRRARQELARLDDEVGLGIFTAKLTALCDTAEAVGGAAKPSGAGGGDCGIALLDAEASREISHVRQRWEAAGVLPLPIRPALEGNEK
ncbi:phosphomevalonate kinase [Streptomyces sp. NBC_00873]|uniref:phosphomevalonate kinase n=1 Tax=unclassified Streptomyces TaxID=2593676 RepID=UPI003868DD7F|nr:phosphomevalonate kinase [Streptomyces sp. NBC_00873]WSY96694.1 phosphomevalonate kinase [Streptomyces sp. NBC_00873]WTA41532.1 phosphomevalonate kinase [Streptomyces sp. NBC_00842]WTA48364.1 phosphomevalonate kinase [Streptomyces sp. NBC_00842]